MSSSLVANPEAPAARRWLFLTILAFMLIWFVGLAGQSAAVPPVGFGLGPPLSLNLHLPSWLVTVILWSAYLIGAAAVWWGLRVRMWISASDAALGSVGLAVASLWAAPQGSADHLSYIAYGRIASLGGDPYRVSPTEWLTSHPQDSVVAAAQAPWADTVSVYGPVATAVQLACAWLGGGGVHLTVWLWQLICAASYLGLVAALWFMFAGAARLRVLLLVAWNPVIIGPVLFGAHIDILAMALAAAAVAVGLRRPWLAGALGAAALSVKLPYGVVLVGLMVAALLLAGREAPRARRSALGVAAGALPVLILGHLWSGPHTYDQARVASRFTTLASPWRAVANAASALGGQGARSWVLMLAPVVVAATAVLLWQLIRNRPCALRRPDHSRGTILRTMLVLGGAWTLAAPYVLPWYDLLLWVPLVALVPAGRRPLELLALVHTTMLALAYVPGRVDGVAPLVEQVTLAVRSGVSPAVLLGAGGLLLGWAMAERRATPAA